MKKTPRICVNAYQAPDIEGFTTCIAQSESLQEINPGMYMHKTADDNQWCIDCKHFVRVQKKHDGFKRREVWR